MLWCAAQNSACLHSATATKEKHAHATQGQILLSECCLHITWIFMLCLVTHNIKIQIIYMHNFQFGWTSQGPQG